MSISRAQPGTEQSRTSGFHATSRWQRLTARERIPCPSRRRYVAAPEYIGWSWWQRGVTRVLHNRFNNNLSPGWPCTPPTISQTSRSQHTRYLSPIWSFHGHIPICQRAGVCQLLPTFYSVGFHPSLIRSRLIRTLLSTCHCHGGIRRASCRPRRNLLSGEQPSSCRHHRWF